MPAKYWASWASVSIPNVITHQGGRCKCYLFTAPNHGQRTTESASQGPAGSGAGLRHHADDADDRPHRKPAIGGYRWRRVAQEYNPREPRIVRPGRAGGPPGIDPYARSGVCHAAGDGSGNGSWRSPHHHVPGRQPRPAGVALTSPGKGLNQMKSFLTLAGIVFVAVLIEISLIYINKVRGGNLGFTFSLKPTMEVF